MPRMDRICPNNTTVSDQCGTLVVILHKTAVFQKRADGSIVLNSGGWRTVTTKNRMNQAFRQLAPSMRASVYQKDGDWFVQVGGYETGFNMPFHDGMVLAAERGPMQ